MAKQFGLTFLTFLLISTQGYSQTIEKLRQNIEQIINSKNAVVGVAISGMDNEDTLSINGKKHFPLQSVFKLPIALTMLAEIDKGNFSFDQKIEIKKGELLPGLGVQYEKSIPKAQHFQSLKFLNIQLH